MTEPSSDVWGVTVLNRAAAGFVGENSQVRAVVRAKSRTAAGRYLAGAGLYVDHGRASRHLAEYGSVTGNPTEVAACQVEGQVFVGPTLGGAGQRLVAWPPPELLG